MPDSAELFANLIPCDRYAFPFIDRFAQFGTVFEQGRGMGPCMMALRSTNLTAQAVDCLLNLWVDIDGQLAPVVRQELSHLPWLVRERGQIDLADGCIAVVAEHCYLSPRVLASRFRFSASGASSLRCTVLYSGLTTGDRHNRSAQQLVDHGLEADHPLRRNWLRCQGSMIEGGLHDECGQLPAPGFQVRSAGGLASGCSDQPLWMGLGTEREVSTDQACGLHYQFSGVLSVAPGSPVDHHFTCEATVATQACAEPLRQAIDPASLDIDAAITEARCAFERNVALDTPPACPPHLQRKAWRARWALLRCGYQADGNGGEFGHDIACTCVANNGGFTRNFFWDGLFTSAALAPWNPTFARGAMKTVFCRQDAAGWNPEHVWNYQVPGRSVLGQAQAPVASWAMERYLAVNPDDEAFLADFYPTMMCNHRHWLRCADRDGDGLMEWQWGGQTADDSPLYDLFTGGTTSWLGPQASVSLNAFLHRDAHSLAAFAERLGKQDEARWLRDEAAKRHEAFMRVCYVPEEHRFWDFCHMTGRHVKAKTFYMCWPIWAGMEMPAATKRALIEEVLLDPAQFFGPIPFPSVAYDEKSYDENQYWRGKAWPQISWWLLEMLEREGYHEAAAEARKRLLAAWLRDPSFPENMRTDPNKYEAHHQPDYNWGIAFASMLMDGAPAAI
ncbi:MAG: trehalase family glycosidase [Planctomycetota bacterium]|jgi:hypothetical protein|nr:trehalase family glycosidase [Planctomycetota bacterium]